MHFKALNGRSVVCAGPLWSSPCVPIHRFEIQNSKYETLTHNGTYGLEELLWGKIFQIRTTRLLKHTTNFFLKIFGGLFIFYSVGGRWRWDSPVETCGCSPFVLVLSPAFVLDVWIQDWMLSPTPAVTNHNDFRITSTTHFGGTDQSLQQSTMSRILDNGIADVHISLNVNKYPVFNEDGVFTQGTLNSGDTAWMLAATALVLLMTMPGLAIYYSGMVRDKNVLACKYIGLKISSNKSPSH